MFRDGLEDTTMNSKLMTLAFAASVACVGLAQAHHSAAVLYVLDQERTIEGVVKEFRLGNPHARIYLTVKGEDGEDQAWMAEGGSRTVLLRKGWTGNEVKPGDYVKIVGHPSRDGSFLLHWQTLHLADGAELFGEDLDPNLLEERRRRRE
jgi:hypothetical protein